MKVTMPWWKAERRRVVAAHRADGSPATSLCAATGADWRCRSCGFRGEGRPGAECPTCHAATVTVENGCAWAVRT
jgi:rubrerythrin